jgi:hypothetical protein
VGDVDPEEIEDLINELEDLSDSGPDVDTISVGSTPKPSLRYTALQSVFRIHDILVRMVRIRIHDT